jgi:molybdopterin molybdotransferase
MSKVSPSYISVNHCLNLLLKNVLLPVKKEKVHTLQSMGRVLSKDIVARTNVPKYNTSHMDGYAVRAEDITEASINSPVYLKISRYESALGSMSSHRLKKAEAFRIHTGGNLPKGSDTVVPIEETKLISNEQKIQISGPSKPGNFVYLSGSDIKKGNKMMYKNQTIGPQHIGLLATLHLSTVSVYSKPVISIIPTGNELTNDIEEIKNKTDSGKIVNTNSHILASLIKELGGDPIDMGITPDDPLILREKIKHALTFSDLLLTVGGTSAGKFDIVKSTLTEMDSTALIASRIKLDRGRVAGLGALDGKPIIVLPGPIQGALNTFFVFARPLMSILSGRNRIEPSYVNAILTDKWNARKKFSDFRKILYVKLSYSKLKEFFYAKPITGDTQSISMISESNAYVIIHEKVTELLPGVKVKVILIPGFSSNYDLYL